ncbi:MAG: hypothetical protein EOO40_07640, partial [Deltaproteobacteria bacterium]
MPRLRLRAPRSRPRTHASPGLVFRPPQVVARDQQTLEVRQFYPLPSGLDEALDYTMEAYFFFPRSFGIAPATWPREIFYRNTNILSRLHAHGLSLKVLKNVAHPHNPGALLLDHIGALVTEQAHGGAAMTALAQIYGAELSDAIRSETRQLAWQVRQSRNSKDLAAIFSSSQTLARDCLDALAALRRVRVAAQAFVAIVPPSLLSCLEFAEEYTAAVIDERLSDVAVQMRRNRYAYDGSCTTVATCALLGRALEELKARRAALGFVRPSSPEGEYYTYRLSLLKKELQRSLYVNTRALSTDSFYSNGAAMVGAGIAATWATLAQVPFINNAIRNSVGSLLVASALGIVAYILKDRLKDWVKQK